MDKIRDWLYIGNWRDAADGDYLRSEGIKAILNLVEQTRHDGIILKYLPVDDGEYLKQADLSTGLWFLKLQYKENNPVLVNCGAGISRSSTFCMAILMEVEGLSLYEAYREVKRHHSQAQPHPKLAVSLAQYHDIELTEVDWFRFLYG